MSKYAKAIAGGATALVVYVAAQAGLELPEEVTAALTTLVTALVVWRVPNAPTPVRVEHVPPPPLTPPY